MKVSRRDFIKAGVTGSAAIGLSGPMISSKWFQPTSASVQVEESEKFTYHTPNCGGRCAFKCSVQDEKLALIQPNVWPDEQFTLVCLKGLSEVERVYSPDRIQAPLKRVGERGKGEFVTISWDEALTTIADKLQGLKDDHGGESILISKSSGVEHSYEFLHNLLGITNAGWPGIDIGYANGLLETIGGYSFGVEFNEIYAPTQNEITDWVNSKTIIMISCNLVETNITDSKFFFNAMDAGAKIVVIDPTYSTTASKANQWISIEPGTDSALMLGMVSIILDNDWYDKDYLIKNTSSPFLIRVDNGQFLRLNGDENDDVETNPNLIWDENSNSVKPFNDDGVKPVLDGEFTVDGIKVKTVFTTLKENQKQYTLEWAAKKTDIDEDIILQLTEDYVKRGPAVITWGFGGGDKLTNADILGHVAALLGALTGNIGITGGSVGSVSHHFAVNFAAQNPWPFPEEFQGLYLDQSEMPIHDLREKENPVKAVINIGNTLQQHWANFNKTKEWLDTLDFIITIDPFHNSSANYSDIVLPATTAFESEYDIVNMQINRNHVLLSEKVIEPLHDSKSDFQIEKELLAKFDLDKYHPETPEEWIENRLDSDDPALEGINVKSLKENDYIMRLNAPEGPYRSHEDKNSFKDHKYNTPTSKIEIYHERLLEDGQALPNYENPDEVYADNPLREKFPLQFSQAHTRYVVHSQFANSRWINEIRGGPKLDINPIDAKERGLKNGDEVEVFNDRGSFQAECKFTEAQRPGQVRMPEGWWTEHMIDGNLQNVTNEALNKRQYKFYPGPVIAYNDTLVEVKKK